MEPLRVLLVDKHIVFRKAVTALLAPFPSMRVVGEAGGGQEAIARARETRPDAILIDPVVPESEGLSVMRVIKSEMPHVQIIAVSLSGGERELFAGVKNGADGFLRHKDDAAQLLGMLEAVRLGQAPVSRPLASQILQEFQEMERSKGFSNAARVRLAPTEARVLELVANGWSSYEIADALAVSIDAVTLSLRGVLAKLHLLNNVPVPLPTVPQPIGMAIASA